MNDAAYDMYKENKNLIAWFEGLKEPEKLGEAEHDFCLGVRQAMLKFEQINQDYLDRFEKEMINKLKVKWPLVVKEFDTAYLNYIDLGNYTMFRMCLVKKFTPRLGLFVSIEDRGSFFFGVNEFLHKNYVAEKLFLQGDSGQVADFLNAQLKHEGNQQGHYYSQVINDVEPYGLLDEERIMPWKPEIISHLG